MDELHTADQQAADDLFANYPTAAGVYDEMLGGGSVRRPYVNLSRAAAGFTADEMRSRSDYLSSTYLDQGVTFDVGGEERPFPLDIVPRIVAEDVWAGISAGVKQRVKALEAFLADVYGAGHVFADGVIPRHVVTSSPHFHRVVAGLHGRCLDQLRLVVTVLHQHLPGTHRLLGRVVAGDVGVAEQLPRLRHRPRACPGIGISTYRCWRRLRWVPCLAISNRRSVSR